MFDQTLSLQEQMRKLSRTMCETRCHVKTMNDNLIQEETQRRKVEIELRDALEKTQAANRAKDEFLANVSHELRTPLTAILGLSDQIDLDPTNPKTKDYLRSIQKSAILLKVLVEEMMSFSKIESGTIRINNRPFNLLEKCDSLCAVLTNLAHEKGLEFTQDIKLSAPEYWGASLQIKQILMSLIENAIKFTEKGSVHVRVREFRKEGQNFVNFKVIDTGIGIARWHKKKIFENFVQLDSSPTRNFGGIGLGLSISQKLVTLLNGKIRVYSELHRGSVFSLSIPLEKTPNSREKNSVETQNIFKNNVTVTELRDKKLLIVEDNEINSLLLEQMLEPEKNKITTAENGKIGFGYFLNQSFDAILTDLQMPVMDGYSLITAIRQWEKEEQKPEIPIIVISAHAFDADKKRALDLGANAYLTKPVYREDLLRQVLLSIRNR